MKAKTLLVAATLLLAACGGSSKKPAMVADPVTTGPDGLPADLDGGTGSDSDPAMAEDADGGAPASGSGSGSGSGDGAAMLKGDEEGAKAFLAQFVAPNADHAALTRGLRPTSNDYKTMFDAKAAAKIEAAQAKDWNSNKAVIKPKPNQTEVKVWSATGADLAAGKGAASEFPGGYKKVGKHLAPSVLFFRFKFVEAGKDVGTAYDGLSFVNGHWVIAPKPWLAMDGKGDADSSDGEGGKPKGKPKKKKK